MSNRWRLSRCMLWVFIAALLLARVSVPYWKPRAHYIEFNFGVGTLTVSHHRTLGQWDHVVQCTILTCKPSGCP